MSYYTICSNWLIDSLTFLHRKNRKSDLTLLRFKLLQQLIFVYRIFMKWRLVRNIIIQNIFWIHEFKAFLKSFILGKMKSKPWYFVRIHHRLQKSSSSTATVLNIMVSLTVIASHSRTSTAQWTVVWAKCNRLDSFPEGKTGLLRSVRQCHQWWAQGTHQNKPWPGFWSPKIGQMSTSHGAHLWEKGPRFSSPAISTQPLFADWHFVEHWTPAPNWRTPGGDIQAP